MFSPPLKVKGKSTLLTVIRKYFVDGKGGILLSELNECIPNGEKVVEVPLHFLQNFLVARKCCDHSEHPSE